MNKKGFTLIEIIGAIVILGIIAIMAFATYTSSLKGFRESYYKDTVRTIEKAGKEFFTDNRNYRPQKILNAQEVKLDLLQTKNYINNVVDYNGGSCSLNSYVLVIKEGKDDYTYHGCLICEDDGYDNTKDDVYCDRTWLDPTKVKYGLGEMEDIYIYKGTKRDELRDLLELPVSYEREDANGNIIASKRGTKEGDPTILPLNIDVVNTEVVGDYYVSYEYSGETKERKVIVYENASPSIEYRKKNTRITKIDGTTETDNYDEMVNGQPKNAYTSGAWVQKIRVRINPIEIADPSVTISKYQWNKDNKWQDFNCTGNPCTKEISEEMNQTVQFRVIDSNGHISKTTNPITFRIDNTAPVCELEIPTTIGENGWYNTDVTIRFKTKYDNKRTEDTSLVSGYDEANLKYNIQLSTANITKGVRVASVVRNQDGTSLQYVGFVIDPAENYVRCLSNTFKRDATKPTCSLSGHASITCTDPKSTTDAAISKINRWYYGRGTPSESNYTSVNAVTPLNVTGSVPSAGIYNLYAKDVAGNVSNVQQYTYYNVTYDLHGGTVSPNKTSDIIRNGQNADLTPVASKDGYIFKGWNTDQNASTGLTSHKVTNHVTLHAIYEACGQGYYCKNNVKTGCPAGYYGKSGVTTGSTRDNACNACGQGYYCAGVNDRNGCPAGYYGKSGVTTGSTRDNACNACGQGYYCAGVNDRNGCPAGYYGKTNVTTGSTRDNACNACGQGYYCGGVNDRNGCPCGYYGKANVTTGSTIDNACNTCEKGNYCSGVNEKSACSDGYISAAGACTCSACPSGQTSNSDHTECYALKPRVTMWKYEAAVTGSQCGVGDATEVSSLLWTCNGADYCQSINASNCRLYAFWVEPPEGQSFTKIKIHFDDLPDHHVSTNNEYEGAPSSLPRFQGMTYFPDTCTENTCENGDGTGNNFFSWDNTYMFRFRPCKAEIKGETLKGYVEVWYSSGGSAKSNFSYSVSS